MPNPEQIHQLLQTLTTLESIIMDLNHKIPELNNCITCGEFISGLLNQELQSKLHQLHTIQEEFAIQFTDLLAEPLPASINAARSQLEECRKKAEAAQKYQESINFFMALHSDEESVEVLLESRKRVLASLDFMRMEEAQMKEAGEIYKQLFEAFQEKDPIRRFSILYRLSPHLEEPIAAEIQFERLKVLDCPAAKEESLTLDDSFEKNRFFQESCNDQTQAKLSHEDDKVQTQTSLSQERSNHQTEFKLSDETNKNQTLTDPFDEIGKNQTLTKPFDENSNHQTLTDLSSESGSNQTRTTPSDENDSNQVLTILSDENSKNQAQNLPSVENGKNQNQTTEETPTDEAASAASLPALQTEEETIWQAIEADRPEDLITKEDTSLLEVCLSPKASEKPKVKEFKNEITKQRETFLPKLDCLIEAYECFGYSRESIALGRNKDIGYYDFVTQKLWQSGYLKKYTVKQTGEFYTLSPKGDKLFSLQDALSFIRKFSRKRIESPAGKQYIEDNSNSAINRLLCQSAFGKTLLLNPEYTFHRQMDCLGSDYFFMGFPDVIEDKNIIFLGITSESPEQFKEFYKHVKKLPKDKDLCIVIGLTRETACTLAKWIAKISEADAHIPVWYCAYSENTIYDLATNDIANIMELSESDLFPEEELSEMTAADESATAAEPARPNDDDIYTPIPFQEEPEQPPNLTAALSENEKQSWDSVYKEMLANRKFYCATAYVKALSKKIPDYNSVYRQLAYALNDPMNKCSYRSDTIFNVFYSDENPLSDYYVIAAAMRNYFLNQFSYDYSLQQLQTMLSGNRILRKEPVLDQILYTLQQFKTNHHTGIDCYADYREKEKASWEIRLEENRREAKSYYDQYSAGVLKENTSHKRFIETTKLLLGSGSDLSEYLLIVIHDDRAMMELLEDFLSQHYIKDQTAICEDNIDTAKIDLILNNYWDLAAQNMRLVKKTSDLMGSLRMNLFKKVNKIVRVLCNYVFWVKSTVACEDNPALQEYKKIRTPLLTDIKNALDKLSEVKSEDLTARAGNAILMETLEEMKARLEGDYKEGSHKYFYINFLKNDKVLLEDDFLPILDDVLELPAFSIENRIVDHYQSKELDWDTRLNEIINGKDDYGSAELILKYLKTQQIALINKDLLSLSIEEAAAFPQKDMIHKRSEFIEDLELAQSYGQIDNTVENSKETIIQIMDTWYQWANETKNYGFFAKILTAFKQRIREAAQTQAVELERNLDIYLQENPGWQEENLTRDAVAQIKDRIHQQNYAAAEDLLNRLLTNDLDLETDLHPMDYLAEFLNEYEINYRKTANSGATLKALVSPYQINKDTKGAGRLLENWPRGSGVGDAMLRSLLTALGFHPDLVKEDPAIQGKMKSYLVTLQRPENGRKNNYRHPISAFGSEAEVNGFRVVCIFGKSDASRLIDTFREIGNAKNTIVLLDYALTLADRRTLARKTKTDLNGKIFAVIDRITIFYLAKHYTETAVNRMLMAVIMPFASYQPYIDKSADVMPQEIFMGRKKELEKIESPTGVNIVYGGRQLGKTALLRMAKKNIDMDENGDRAVIVNAWRKDYKKTSLAISKALYDEGILKTENITEDWNELARDIKNRLRDTREPIPYFLLMIDEADSFIESCESIDYQPFNALKDIQAIGSGRFKFVVAGLRNIVRFKQTAALDNNGVLTHLDSLTVKPFKSTEARELLEVPLSYLGFRFPKEDNETEVLISTIFGTTNYFPGLIQLYCTKLIEAMKKNYAGYSESKTPPYYVRKEHIKKVLADKTLQEGIREKFFITLKVGEDDYYYIIALLAAHHYHESKSQNGCSPQDLLALAESLLIRKLSSISTENITALMEEMCELNVLQHIGNGRYRFARHSFCQMMGTIQQIDDELLKYMED